MTVHVHDVFLPFDYPNNYDERGYTEQYLLQCLLHASHRYRTLLATHWLSRQHGSSMRAVFGEEVAPTRSTSARRSGSRSGAGRAERRIDALLRGIDRPRSRATHAANRCPALRRPLRISRPIRSICSSVRSW